MSGWGLRIRLDAGGFYAKSRGVAVLSKPFPTREAAEEVRRAMPNGAEFEVVEQIELIVSVSPEQLRRIDNPCCDRGPCSNLLDHDGECSL